jgi:hypothetical protein
LNLVGELDAELQGELAAFGGRFAGRSHSVKDGVLRFHYNYAGLERTTITGGDFGLKSRGGGADFSMDRRVRNPAASRSTNPNPATP